MTKFMLYDETGEWHGDYSSIEEAIKTVCYLKTRDYYLLSEDKKNIN